jgi:hypothetical protein
MLVRNEEDQPEELGDDGGMNEHLQTKEQFDLAEEDVALYVTIPDRLIGERHKQL